MNRETELTPRWDFGAATRQSLRNESLAKALFRATAKFDDGRRALMAALPESDLLREKARQIKDDVLQHLDRYLAQFADSVEKAGGIVHWAKTGDDANALVASIARERNVKRIVKAKTMVSEETHLNEALEREGFCVMETDLGEYILQVAGDRPSHIVVPAVHRTKEEIAELFNTSFGVSLPPEPAEITKFARARLREEFANADMGITGANFAAADTGTVIQVTNEGNGRLCATWPPVQVVFMGIEKIIPRLEDLPVFLKLLARSATGQPMTVYTNLITGPRREGEGDGARELHVILIDNGRTAVLGSEYRQSLRCIRCGACLNTCPVYRNVGGHTYGSVYPGPIGSVLSPLYEGRSRFSALPHASSLCGACYQACPMKINIPHMLTAMRAEQAERGDNHVLERLGMRLWALAMRSPLLYRFGGTALRWGMLPLSSEGWVSSLPYPFSGWTKRRDFPLPAKKSFRGSFKE